MLSLREAADVLRTDRRTRKEEGTAMVTKAKALGLRLNENQVTKRNAQQKVCQIVTPKPSKT